VAPGNNRAEDSKVEEVHILQDTLGTLEVRKNDVRGSSEQMEAAEMVEAYAAAVERTLIPKTEEVQVRIRKSRHRQIRCHFHLVVKGGKVEICGLTVEARSKSAVYAVPPKERKQEAVRYGCLRVSVGLVQRRVLLVERQQQVVVTVTEQVRPAVAQARHHLIEALPCCFHEPHLLRLP
jgi:hypothetical protein